MSKKVTVGTFGFNEAVGFYCQRWEDKGSDQREKQWWRGEVYAISEV